MTRAVGAAALLVVLMLPTLAQGQVPRVGESYVDFSITAERTYGLVVRSVVGSGPGGTTLSNQIKLPFSIRDLSVDGEAAGTAGSALYSTFSYEYRWVGGQPDGWERLIEEPTGVAPNTKRGDVLNGAITLTVEPRTLKREAFLEMTVTMRGQSPRNDLVAVKNLTFGALIFPAPAIQIGIIYADREETGIARAPNEAPPNTLVTIPVEVENADIYQQKVNIDLIIDDNEDEGIDSTVLPVIGGGSYILEANTTYIFNLTFMTPKAQFWYWGTPLQYTVRVVNSQNTAIGQTAGGVLIVDGFYVGRQLLIIIPLILLLAALFLWLLVAAKRYYDERVLGKPIPPWKIPEEAAKLEALRKTDPRTFYITRYFLMEEEYSSALLWFASFKRRNKRQIKNEAASARYRERASALVAPPLGRFDRRAERLKRRYQRKQERQRLKLEAKLERLQTRLDLHYEEDYEKDHKKWEEKVEKLKKKANRPWYREHKNWEKQVGKALDKWEKPFRKDQAKHEKRVAKILGKHEVRVKKKDKPAWKDWREAVENAKKENVLREQEGREPIPLPELRSEEVEYPDLPPAFKTPPKPKLPAEPEAPVVKGLPPEPQMLKPKLEASHLARKARRARRKTDRKVRRFERKLHRLLARNERDRVRAIAKADRKRRKLNRKSHTVLEPTLVDRLLRLTPEDRERRAHKTLLKTLAKEKLRAVEENERARLEVLEVEAQRREAEMMARLIRDKAEVRRSGASAAARVEGRSVEDDRKALVELRADHEERLAKERAKSAARVESERDRVAKELQAQLAEELIKERLGPEAAAPEAAKAPEPERAPTKPRRK